MKYLYCSYFKLACLNIILFLVFSPVFLLADKGVHAFAIIKEEELNTKQSPWFTGPILSPSARTIPAPHVNYEPYIYWAQNQGVYDAHWKSHSRSTFNNVLTQGTFQVGLNSFMEFDFALQFSYTQCKGSHDWRVNDLPISLSFQLYKGDPVDKGWLPAIKLKLNANVPLGKYQKLNPDKHGTDLGGSGNWAPSIGLVFGRLFHFTGIHFLAVRYFIAYGVPLPLGVKGINSYGGAVHTKGTVYPGNVFLNLVGMEFSLTQRWVLACDFQYQHNNKNRFSGHSGGKAPIAPSSEQASIAPAIEYNWSNNVGIIGGTWFTLAGRNAAKFTQWVVAINIYV